MKPSFIGRLLLIGTVMAVVFLLIWNQRAIERLKVANKGLLIASQETKRLASENQQISRLRLLNEEAEKLQDANHDLPKLRNEVHQL
ncbi:MAG: hypothetical protein ABIP76_12170, partial [Verrucomicrobiota bacterium]